MFKSLRDRLKGWTEKFSKSKEEEVEEIEEKSVKKKKPEKEIKEKKSKEDKKKEKESEKKSREEEKKNKEEEKQIKKKLEREKKELEKKQVQEEKKKLKEEKHKEKPEEIEMPTKFNVGTQKVEPDYDKLKEKIEEIEEEKEASKPGTRSFFQKITSGTGKVKISEKDFDEYKDDLEMLLLENNVAFEVSDEVIKKLREKIVGKEILRKEMEEEIKDALREIISDILIEPFDVVKKILDKKDKEKEPFVMLFFGINGSGKTTTIAKISEYLRKRELSTVLAAGDTFRAASIEQLKEHGSRIGIKVIAHEYGSDPASVGFDAIQYAKKNHIDVVLIDTAGRMHTEVNLIKEMEKINRVCKPDLKIFIGESITGNDATEQARAFNEKIGIDGITLTKADIDEKGGTALSVGFVTGKPIIFLGMGQEYKDIEYFDKSKFLDKLGLD